jgi:hypothetical protein
MNGWELIEFYSEPRTKMLSFNSSDWSELVHLVRDAGLGASLLPTIQQLDFAEKDRVIDHAFSYFFFAEKQYLTIIRELLELEKVFAECGYPVLLVKGVSYRIAQFQYAQFRLFSDIDVLVQPKNFPDAVERLKLNGYIEQTTSDYERKYYLNWSHQYPPLRHLMRTAEIDLHHTIFFARSRIKIDIDAFVSRSVSVDGSAFSIPSAPDMFVHACLHLFYQEENHKLVKDLIDLHCLYNQIACKADILNASSIVNMKSAIAYGILVQSWFFKANISEEEQQFVNTYSSVLKRKLIRWLLKSILQDKGISKRLSHLIWYFRGHLIKMNLPTLVYHTVMKVSLSFLQSRRLGRQQKLLDTENLPKDAHSNNS